MNTHQRFDSIPVDFDEDETIAQPRSGSFRIIETRLPEAGRDYPRHRAEYDEMFATDELCQAYLERLRWPRGFRCASCGSRHEPWRSGTGLLACVECKALSAVTQGSLFHGAAIPLCRWFRALWDLTARESGTHANDLQRALELRDRAPAEHCLEAVRAAMRLPTRRKLRGTVEVAKTMIEVSQRGMLGRPSTARVQVLVAAERIGNDVGQVRLRHLRQVGASEVVDFVRSNVEPGSEVHTPPWIGYEPLDRLGYVHRRAPQSVPAHSMPDIEQIGGVLRLWLWSTPEVTGAALQGYLDEFTFRFNRRSYPSGLLFYRLMILSALFDSPDEELLGIAAVS